MYLCRHGAPLYQCHPVSVGAGRIIAIGPDPPSRQLSGQMDKELHA